MSAITTTRRDAPRMRVGGVGVDLMTRDQALKRILTACAAHGRPLAVASANLEHITHFGRGGRWAGCLEATVAGASPDWLVLLDGAPVVREARIRSGGHWPRLAGSDLLGPILDAAQERGLSLGVLGGTREAHRALALRLAAEWPRLRVSGMWSPSRAEVGDRAANLDLTRRVRHARTDLLLVALGKPRQELWIHEHAHATGAGAILAFGAALDYLAGTSERAPAWLQDHGLEWSWRLAHEPVRLAARYLVNGPGALLALHGTRGSEPAGSAARPAPIPAEPAPPTGPRGVGQGLTPPARHETARHETGRRTTRDSVSELVGAEGHADVSVLVVTHNSERHVTQLLRALRSQRGGLRLRVLVADNASTDSTVSLLAEQPTVRVLRTGANLGYAGGINALRPLVGDCEAVLVLNPDLSPAPDAIVALLGRLRHVGGGLVVPQLRAADGALHHSLRREPSLTRAWGDALLGERARGAAWSETETNPDAYAHAHPVQWATGAALLVDSGLQRRLGPWDERYFLYSEETDYFRRARLAGARIWYEPASSMVHEGAGSGSSASLHALLNVNRVRYIRAYHGPAYAALFRAAVATRAALRCGRGPDREALLRLLREASWAGLPGPDGGVRAPAAAAAPAAAPAADGEPDTMPDGVVIIPAHNESSVLPRLLERLAPAAVAGSLEVIVACNGCTDDSAQVASRYPGIRVLEVEQASKVAALNAADAATEHFPRLYLDADIDITLSSLAQTLHALRAPGALAARPAFDYEVRGSSAAVRAFYRARRRLPSTTMALWGAGIYGLSAAGHGRLGSFPPVTADDLYVDGCFGPQEKLILPVVPVRVRVPRGAQQLLSVLRRVYRGQAELSATTASTPAALPAGQSAVPSAGTGRTARELLASITSPTAALDAAIYAGFVALARLPRRGVAVWERDESTR